MNSIALVLHSLCATAWVGGMFFSYTVLRPAASELAPPERLALWVSCFERFFRWVWVTIILLPITGIVLSYNLHGGLASAPLHVLAMTALSIAMIGLFLLLYLVPYPRLKSYTADGLYPQAANELATIRRIIAINLSLGCIVIMFATGGRLL